MANKHLTPEQQKMDTMIKRINSQMVQAAKTFGVNSREYQQYESIIFGFGWSGKQHNPVSIGAGNIIRKNADGILQISRSRVALFDLTTFKSYTRAVTALTNLPTVREAKKQALQAYTGRTGITPKTKAEKEAAIKEEIAAEQTAAAAFESALQEIYRMERERGVSYQGLDEIRKLSKGSGTSLSDLSKMMEIADNIVKQEDQRIVENALQGY